jgi:hypothetical protein
MGRMPGIAEYVVVVGRCRFYICRHVLQMRGGTASRSSSARAQQAPEGDQPGAGLERFAGQAACDQQPRELAEITADAFDLQLTAALQQFAVQLAAGKQGGEYRLAVEADGRVEQAVITGNALTFMPEQLASRRNIQRGLEVAAVEALVCSGAAKGDDVPVEQAGVTMQVDLCVQFGLAPA